MNKEEFALRQREAKPYHDKYDEILSSLNKNLTTSTTQEAKFVDIAFLQAKGYLSFNAYQDGDGQFLLRLEGEGLIFITEGGFKEQDRIAKERNDELELSGELARRSIKTSNISLWITGIATAITLLTLIYTVLKDVYFYCRRTFVFRHAIDSR